MKKLLNKKGFTLVELLAVIVVLAVIMVIATQAIGNVLEKNTAKSFKSSLDMVAKQAKQAYVMEGTSLTLGDIRELVDYDYAQYEIYFGTSASVAKTTGTDTTKPSNTETYVCIKPNGNGKFAGMDAAVLKEVFGEGKYATDGTVCKEYTK